MGSSQYPDRITSDIGVKVTSTQPSNPNIGDLWIDTSAEVPSVDLTTTRLPGTNLLHNGAFQVHQRSAAGTTVAVSGTSATYRTADRWMFICTNAGTANDAAWTESVENDGPPGTGLRKSLKIACTQADASLSSGDLAAVQHRIEGQNLLSVKKGSANAEQLTLSFWVKSNITGTFICPIQDIDNTRQVCRTYTINSPGVWEYKSVTYPADIIGAFDNDNGRSLDVSFGLSAGSNYTSGTLAASWAPTVDANFYPGQTNLASAVGNYWQISGVQLEVGSAATAFQHKSFGDELRECQRYYWMAASGYNEVIGMAHAYNATTLYTVMQPPVAMRTAPTWAGQTGTDYFIYLYNSNSDPFDGFSVGSVTTERRIELTSSGGVSATANSTGWVRQNSANAKTAFSADL